MQNTNMNIALFGGSFDPPHIGHEKIINHANDYLDIDKLIVMPTYLNPFKEKFLFSPKIRLDLMKILCSKYKKTCVSSYEVKNKKQIQTIQTVNYLYKKYDINKFYLILGADNIKHLHLWDKYELLKNKVIFLVVTRNNIKVKHYKTININCNATSTKIRETLDISMIPNIIQQKVKKIWKIE